MQLIGCIQFLFIKTLSFYHKSGEGKTEIKSESDVLCEYKPKVFFPWITKGEARGHSITGFIFQCSNRNAWYVGQTNQ